MHLPSSAVVGGFRGPALHTRTEMSKKRGNGRKSRPSRAGRTPTDPAAALRKRIAALEQELVAERRRSSTAVEQQTATAEILQIIAGSPVDLEPVAQAIADSAFRLCECTIAGVLRFDGQLIHWVAGRGTSEAAETALQSFWPRPPDPMTLTGRTILARHSVHVQDAESDPDYVTWVSRAHRAA